MTAHAERDFLRLTPSTFALLVGVELAAVRRAPKRRRRRRGESTSDALTNLCVRLSARFGRVW